MHTGHPFICTVLPIMSIYTIPIHILKVTLKKTQKKEEKNKKKYKKT